MSLSNLAFPKDKLTDCRPWRVNWFGHGVSVFVATANEGTPRV
jgi:hypothetical protein